MTRLPLKSFCKDCSVIVIWLFQSRPCCKCDHLAADCFFWFEQISAKYDLIYVITKLGLLFVYDLETATAVYRNRISPDPIFLTADAPSVGGFYAVNRRGQVLLATVNEATIVPFVSNQVCCSWNIWLSDGSHSPYSNHCPCKVALLIYLQALMAWVHLFSSALWTTIRFMLQPNMVYVLVPLGLQKVQFCTL